MAKRKRKGTKKPAKARSKRVEEVKSRYEIVKDIIVHTRNEYLIHRILDYADLHIIPQSVSLFSSLLSNLTPATSNFTKKEGVRVGRALYDIKRRQKHYLLHEESVADLIQFFERTGHNRLTYSIFPDKFTLNIFDMHKEYIGMKVHQFEAGVISGFLSASKGSHVEVEEQSCSSDGNGNCTFTTVYNKAEDQTKNAKRAIRLFADHIIKEATKEESVYKIKEAPAYYALSSSTIASRRYQKEMKHIAAFIGSEIASGIFPEPKKTGSDYLRRLQRAIELTSPGKPSVKSLKPIKIDVRFDALHSNSELIEITGALLNGMLKYYTTPGTKLTKVHTNKGYTIRIQGK